MDKFKKSKIDYTYNHYGLKAIHKDKVMKKEATIGHQLEVDIFPQKKTELAASAAINMKAIKQLETNVELIGLNFIEC